jgi:uncharacterized protein YdhG (YjbR/CyaY superfamily)
MQSQAKTPELYLAELSEDRKNAVGKLRTTILDNLPKGFEEVMSYGMIGYVVPHTIYPNGYHCNPKLPLPYINIASQKNYIAMYHMGVYGDENLLNWFVAEYPKHSKTKLDIGKGCIRFKKIDAIPYDLIAELVRKITFEGYIARYESNLKTR